MTGVNPSQTTRTFLIILVSLLLPLFPSDASASEQFVQYEDARFQIDIGRQITKFDSNLFLKSQSGPGALFLDLESDLGLTSENSAGYFKGSYRFAERHKIALQYFQNDRKSTKVLDREIEIGDSIWEIDAVLNTTAEAQISELTYEYSIIRDGNLELSILGGFYWLEFATTFEGIANGSDFLTEKTSFQGPLPVLGMDLSYSAGSRWTLRYLSEVFAVSFGNYSGRLNNHRLSAEFLVWKNFGLGLALNQLLLSAEVDDDVVGEIGIENRGTVLYLVGRF